MHKNGVVRWDRRLIIVIIDSTTDRPILLLFVFVLFIYS